MSGRQLKLSLLITADASGVAPATREARSELDGVSTSAAGATAALEKQAAAELTAARGATELTAISKRQTAANDEVAAATSRAVSVLTAQTAAEKLAAAALSGSAAARESLRLALDQEYAAAKRLDDELGALAAAERLGIEISGGYETALERLVLKHDAVAAAAKRQQDTYRQLAAEGRAAYAADQEQSRLNALLGVRDRQGGGAYASFEAFAAAGKLGQDAEAAARGLGLANHEITNLTYQLNDMATMLVSGQSPFVMMMQQGPQIAQIFGRRGLGEIIPALGAGIMQLISPTTLALAGFTALYYGASYAFEAIRGEIDETSGSIEEHQDLIASVASRWGDALPAVKAYNDQLERKRDLEDAEKANRLIAQEKYAPAAARMTDLSVDMADIMATLMHSGADGAAVMRAQQAWIQLEGAVAAATAAGADAIEVQRLLSSEALGVSIPTIDEFAVEIGEFAGELDKANQQAGRFRLTQQEIAAAAAKASAEVQAFSDSLKALQDTAAPSLSAREKLEEDRRRALANASDRIDRDRVNDWYEKARQQIENRLAGAQVPILTRRPNLEDALPSARDFLETQREQLALLELEASLVGASEAVRARAIAALEAEQEIRRRGIPLYGQEAEELRANSAAIAEGQARIAQAEAARSLLESQEERIARTRTEMALVGASAEQRSRAMAVLQAEIDIRRRGIDVNGAWADSIRQAYQAAAEGDLALERAQDAWKMWQSAAESAIDNVFGKLSEGDWKGALKALGDELTSFVFELGVTNPLKNLVAGKNYATLADMPGLVDSIFGRGDADTVIDSLFGDKTVASMSVNAATVMLSGGLPGLGGIPGLNGTGGVGGDLLGNVTRLLTGANSNQPTGDMGLYKQAIRLIESGSFAGNYSAIGPATQSGDRAYGAYQVMGANVPSWTQGALGQSLSIQQFLANPAAQDAVFDKYFGAALSKYGSPQQAASVWFTGRPMTSASMAAADVTGTTGSAYVDNFNAALEKASGSVGALGGQLGQAGEGLAALGKGFGQTGQWFQQFAASAAGGSGSGGWFSGLMSLFGGGQGALNFMNAISPVATKAILAGGGGLYDVGGWTGSGDPRDPAGVVHREEFVFSAPAVRAIGVDNLERMHRAARTGRTYEAGGHVGADPWSVGSGRAGAPTPAPQPQSPVTVRLVMPDGWKAEIVGAARDAASQDTVQIVQDFEAARENRYEGGGRR